MTTKLSPTWKWRLLYCENSKAMVIQVETAIVPEIIWSGQESIGGQQCFILVTEMLGPTLQDFFLHCNRELMVSTAALLAIKLVDECDSA